MIQTITIPLFPEEVKKRYKIFTEICAERKRQNEKWGEQNPPMLYAGFDYARCKTNLEIIRNENDLARGKDNGCWYNILAEEFLEAFLETEPEKQREELVQVAAVAVQIIEYLDRRIGQNETGSNP